MPVPEPVEECHVQSPLLTSPVPQCASPDHVLSSCVSTLGVMGLLRHAALGRPVLAEVTQTFVK